MHNQTSASLVPLGIDPQTPSPWGDCPLCHRPIWTSFVTIPAADGSSSVAAHTGCYYAQPTHEAFSPDGAYAVTVHRDDGPLPLLRAALASQAV